MIKRRKGGAWFGAVGLLVFAGVGARLVWVVFLWAPLQAQYDAGMPISRFDSKLYEMTDLYGEMLALAVALILWTLLVCGASFWLRFSRQRSQS